MSGPSTSPEYTRHLEEGLKQHNEFRNYPKALAEYAEAWKHCRSKPQAGTLKHFYGLATYQMGDKERAVRYLEDAVLFRPRYIDPHIYLAKMYMERDNFRWAMAEILDAELLLPKTDLVKPLDEVKKILVDHSKAAIRGYVKSEVKKAEDSRTFAHPRDAKIHDFLSRFYCDPVSRMWRGLDPVPEVPEEEADGAGVVDGTGTGFLAAMACMKTGKFKDVINLCSRETDDPNGRYWNEAQLVRGTLYLLWGDDRMALANFQNIIDDPDASDRIKSCAHLRAGLVHDLLGSTEESAEHFAKAEELWKENGDIYCHVAAGLTDKDGSAALAVLKKGVEACPDPKGHPLLHVLDLSIRSLSHSISGDKKGVEETVAKLKEMEGKGLLDSPACYAEFAEALRCLGDDEGMKAAYDKATELSGGYNLYQVEKIKATLKKSDEDTVLEAVIKQLEKFTSRSEAFYDPDVAAYAFELIFQVNMILGKYKEGFAAVHMAIFLAPNIFEVKRLWKERTEYEYFVRLAEKMDPKEKAYELKLSRS